ncbi:MAG TPA: zinc ribbon domain-containing protein, partial [Ktedonobacterales bacterium]|nr:zinc ribbon domain-containing protein [Ktedonobacterales bacterium]
PAISRRPTTATSGTRAVARCPACGYPLEPAATICFECGAPIGDDAVDTGPLAIPDYLKAPITIELPVVAWTERAGSARVLTAPPEPANEPPKARHPRRVTRRDVTAAGINLLVTLLLLGGGIEFLVQFRVAPPAVSAQSIYRDPAHRFHFAHPTLWQVVPIEQGVQLVDADGTNTLMLVASPDWGLSASAQADALATLNTLGALPPVQVAGASWEQRAGRVRDTRGVLREIVVLVTVHDATLYTIEYASPDSSFSNLTLLVYQPVLQSFTFESQHATPSPRITPSATSHSSTIRSARV